MTLKQFLEVYLLEHDLAATSEEQLRVTVNHFSSFLGRELAIGDLCSDSVNSYLKNLQSLGRAYSTVKNRRTNLLTIWRYARVRYMNAHPLDFVRRLKPNLPEPKALTEEEARQLVDTAVSWIGKRRFRDGTDMGLYFAAYVRLAWDSGMRKGDILVLPLELLSGRFWVKPNKNKRLMPIDIHESSVEWATRLSRSRGGLSRPFASPCKDRSWFKAARRLTDAAGVNATMKHLRSGCATACAIGEDDIEAASQKLGHRSSDTTKTHYVPSSWRQGRVILPPEL